MAIKRLTSGGQQGDKEFLVEVEMLSRLHHRNLVKLVGYYSSRDSSQNLLCYELVPNGSLEAWLHGSLLSWTTDLMKSSYIYLSFHCPYYGLCILEKNIKLCTFGRFSIHSIDNGPVLLQALWESTVLWIGTPEWRLLLMLPEGLHTCMRIHNPVLSTEISRHQIYCSRTTFMPRLLILA